ncbi:hypothetical protein [Klebsiella pneumoniae]|uniref:hypothetical protein n=1 Tax=Klebsiella pneumoniae TaxID=573 RepID=UPI0004A00416|nr:hypothetical protein [Klebsiella pneumoniae]HDU4011277.1 hypothetical protein [Klebsiella variicola]EKW3956123.1 hypothetical protein [Klebsiella pneumoniae]EKY0467959.1 hypothetical protein [Klebsiella pneumoniae]KDL95223.1 hypothetical protein AE00_00297 [Klebsiella pneumoniae MGH 74]MCE7418523.1 hypothetical protein [Klebsiella pneumoniae]
MTDITELALIKGQKVEAPYYLAECTECGKMYSSSKLIVSRNYFDGDADCYCPHCNAEDADIADLGSGEQPAVMAWNYQQARIDTLVEALEKAQRANGHLREQSAEWERKAISNFEECAKLSQRVEELESRAVTVENLQESAYRAGLTAGWNLGLANNNDGFNKCLAAHAAGIKVEAE